METLINPGKRKSNRWRNKNSISTVPWKTGFQIWLDKGRTLPELPISIKILLKTTSVNKSWLAHFYFYETSMKFNLIFP